MTDIEIPLPKDRNLRYRFFEALPGLISWSLIAFPFVVSLFSPVLAAYFIIAYTMFFFFRAASMAVRVIQGYRIMVDYKKANWMPLLEDLDTPEESLKRWKARKRTTRVERHHFRNLRILAHRADDQVPLKSGDIYHAIVMATYNETRDILEPSVQSLLKSNYPMDKVIFVLAYEERGGSETEETARYLIEEYGDRFGYAMAIKHPKELGYGELQGKGGNITYAGRKLQKFLRQEGIESERVIVTTLDSDHRCDTQYLANLAYTYMMCPERKYTSFQPIPMFLNNIWDAPAPMRVIATGNSFWQVIQTLRPHMLRNFASHAQSMETLVDTDFWSVRTIVEDGHQFWRTYVRYDGHHQVVPIFTPIYQDAVLAATLKRTIKAQFIQLRRWAWGASDVAYLSDKALFQPNDIPKPDVVIKLLRLLEGHVSWAIAPIILGFGGWIPMIANRGAKSNFLIYQLPIVLSRAQFLAMFGIFLVLYLSMKTLPPKTARYRQSKRLWMILQWAWMPIVGIVYSSTTSLNAQTRLMFGWYVGKFDVTEKAVKKDKQEAPVQA